jgi:hypothetical protein
MVTMAITGYEGNKTIGRDGSPIAARKKKASAGASNILWRLPEIKLA